MQHKLVVPGRYDRLEQIAQFIGATGREAGLDQTAIGHCQLAVDEACTNVIEHAYQGEDRGRIEIVADASDGELVIIIRDRGRPFDPSEVPPPNLDYSGLDDLQVGGLGLFFMRQVMDSVEFSRERGTNQLVLVKRRAGRR
jgi:serine/threonine-protein kinase RsbW